MSEYPSRRHLTGPDYFQVVLDAHHRTHGRDGNLSRLAITLEGHLDVHQLTEKISGNEFVRWLFSLRLAQGLFGAPRWEASGKGPPAVQIHDTEDVLKIPVEIDPRQHPALRFDILRQGQTTTTILFSWNHILMDARGAEILLSHLGTGIECEFMHPEPPLAVSWRERLMHIRFMKEYIIDRVRVTPANAVNAGGASRKFAYRNIEFTPEETAALDAHCESHHLRLGKSAFYLAATVRAFDSTLTDGSEHANYWIPVPQDKRRKGVLGPIMSNQVSSLFFGIDKADIGSLKQAANVLSGSMMDQMRAGVPRSNTIMMDSMRYAPLWLYRYLVKSPTKGRLASFFFSDTGISLDAMPDFMGHRLIQAVHYPPASAMPGWTCIFMRVRDRQQVVVCYPEDQDGRKTTLIDRFDAALRKELQGTF